VKETGTLDQRIKQIRSLVEHFLRGEFSFRERSGDEGDEIDEILNKLNRLGETIQQSGKVINNYEQRVLAIMNVLLKYTLFDFSEKAQISGAGDEIDAIALGLNTLGEELSDKIAIEKLHTTELERFASIIETTADAVISLDDKWRINLWNKSAEKIYGFTAKQVAGKKLSEIFPPVDESDQMPEWIEKIERDKEAVSAGLKRRTADGRVIDVSFTLSPVTDRKGDIISISELSRDVTEQIQAEKKLRASEERFRTLVTSVRDYAIISLDRDSNITAWNEGARAMHGYTEEEMLGKHFSVFYTEEDRRVKEPERIISEAIAHRSAGDEGYRTKKNGEKFWASVVINCLRNRKGQVIGFSHITRDLTESRKKDEEIREYTRRLEQKNIELEKKNKELASFAYVSSHDLQEPLRKIQTFADRILDLDEDNLSGAGRDYFKRIESSAGRMQQLIRDLLDYSRLNSPGERCEMHDLKSIVNEVKHDFIEEIRACRAEIEVQDMCKIPVMAFQFRQLVRNLLSNALKFADPSRPPHIKIRSEMVSGDHVKIESVNQSERFCHIIFSDNGIGFEPRFNNQIFEVFQRLHGQEHFPGTGIGLAICKKIVENHNGVIEAQGMPDTGATFHIFLPATDPQDR
jgi:PAS domain S-box-containing protein